MAIPINNNNLYPPTLPTYAETFILGSPYKLFFSISKYNSLADENHGNIGRTALMVIYKQNTNISALKKENAPCDILPVHIYNATSKTSENDPDGDVEKYNLKDRKYYIKINPNDLKEGFEINTYYRVQIRFISSECPNEVPLKISNNWLISNEQYFSEWSTVSLVREISAVEYVVLKGMKDPLQEDSDNIWTSGEVDIAGKIKFEHEEERDTLRSYYLKFFDEEKNIVWESGEIYNQSFDELGENEFNYTVNKVFKDGEKYTLRIGYTTRTLFSNYIDYPILMLDAGLERLNVKFSSVEDVENGRIILNITNDTQDVFNGNLIIRRSCGDSDFTVWEDVAIISVKDSVLNYTFYDYTVQSGKWYRYGVQTKNNEGQRGLLTLYDKSLMVDFEDIFLNGEGKQLCIRYNPQISSFQKTIFENKVDTIGGKYPYIKRNGSSEYKQFPISGLITYFMDKHDYTISGWQDSVRTNLEKKVEGIHNSNATNSLFESPESMYPEDILTQYDSRNIDKMTAEKGGDIIMENFSPWEDVNDTIYEKDFRDKVMDFLYSNTVKLYRSATEGNILIKLMNISFTPNQSLGRKIWTFNATAYEIDECSIENYDKYGIQTIGSAMDYFEFVNNYIGQIEINAKANKNIVKENLEPIYKKDIYHKDKYTTSIKYLDHIKIEFLGDPYLIDISGGDPQVISSNLYSNRENAILGYLVYINDIPVVIRNSKIYELEGEDIEITSVWFPVDTQVFIDYRLMLVQEPVREQIITAFYYIKKLSQLTNVFQFGANAVNFIKSHFNLVSIDNAGRFYQNLNAINGIRVEADEGTIISIKEVGEEYDQEHIIGPTRSLDFWDPKTSVIERILFKGVHIVKATDYESQREILMTNRYIDMTENVNADINNPIKNGIYLKDNKKQIWYKNNWYEVKPIEIGRDETSGNPIYMKDAYNIQCPVSALVDYYCELVKGYYAK